MQENEAKEENRRYICLYRGDPRVCFLLRKQKLPAGEGYIRRSRFVFCLYESGKYLLFHTLTRELLLLEPRDIGCIMDNRLLPDSILKEELSRMLYEHYFLVPEEAPESRTYLELKNILDAYVAHTATSQSDTKTKVGLDDLITAINAVTTAISNSGGSSGGGSSSSSTGEVLIQPYNGNSLGYSSSYPFVVALGGTGSLGTQGSPLYISGGGGSFPARNSVLEISDSSKINSFLTFTSNTGNAAGYATVNTIRPTIVGSYFDSIISSQDPSLAFATEVKNIIKQWLQGVTSSVTINGNNYLVINSGALSI